MLIRDLRAIAHDCAAQAWDMIIERGRYSSFSPQAKFLMQLYIRQELNFQLKKYSVFDQYLE
jgi:hypothetical protein